MRRFLVLGFLGVGGCSSSSFDVGSGDVGVVDSASLDTALDSSAGDSAPADTGSDTAKADLGSDTPRDSNLDGASDAPSDAPTDAPSDTPTDGTCARPPSTSTFATGSLGCAELLTKYPVYFDDARTCTCDDDCNQQIDRGFCGCEAWVSEGNDAYPALVAMQERWKKLSCTVVCPKALCPGAGTAKCEKLSGGPLGKCRVGPG
ncbi:MAG: hypothetical protein JNL79_05130 [Myxococcales bacterium]|nr:hypothetical protein [Myxococcales bacterium]